MVIVGEQLLGLNKQFSIVSRELALPEEDFSLALGLESVIKRYKRMEGALIFGQEVPAEAIIEERLKGPYLTIRPAEAVLACSVESVRMPEGFFGLVQTKGSLARLFITVTCCDGQVEPGFEGKVTFEIANLGPNAISIPVRAKIAQMYVLRCSSRRTPVYRGKYQNAKGPTTALFPTEA
jgi:dCTP deaminase